MPIFVRPVREQLEHDRLIRFLQARHKRKFDVAINAGDEQVAPLKLGGHTFFPDIILTDGKKLAGVIEIETGESVNNLEAMAQWVHFSRARVPFHLYVPVASYDIARRLCEANQVRAAEVWTYRPVLDGFDLVRVATDPSVRGASPGSPKPQPPKSPAKAKSKAPVKSTGKRVQKGRAKPGRAKPAGKSAKPSKSKPARKSGKR